MQGCLQGIASCVGAVSAKLGNGCLEDCVPPPKLDEEEFDRMLKFLSMVPLFRKQLSKADLPLVAKELTRTSWAPGAHVIEQGAEGKVFFIIEKGEAQVVVKEKDSTESVRATLYHGDYFGGHTLLEKRSNVATITSKGPCPLVTLSMSRRKFQKLGLQKKLKFPRRPAIYDGVRTDAMLATGLLPTREQKLRHSKTMNAADEGLVSQAVRSNANLRHAVGDVADAKAESVARVATRLEVEAGTELACAGALPTDFYVIAEGSFDVLLGGDAAHRSVEATVATARSVHSRFAKKEHFLQHLSTVNLMGKEKSERSSLTSPKGKAGARSRTLNFAAVKASRASPAKPPKRKRTSLLDGLAGYHISIPEEQERFRVGDHVAVVVATKDGLSHDTGRVAEVHGAWPDGELVVDFFKPPRQARHRMQHVRPAKDVVTVATLGSGESFGELALLYNTRLVTTFKAIEDSVVFAISRWHFKETFSRESPQLEEHLELLNEVHLLTPLVQAERRELARNSTGVLQFQAGDRVLTQGEHHDDLMFYVIKKGSCVIRIETTDEAGQKVCKEIARHRRGGHFGERMILRKSHVPEFTAEAGPEGMTCLVIAGQLMENFLSTASGETTDYGMPGMLCDAAEYHIQIAERRSRKRIDFVEVELSGLTTISLLGEGGFGAVFLVEARGEEYALKRISKGYAQQAQVTKQICLERDVLSMVDSPFIVHLFQTYKDEQYVFILMELANGGHLYQLLCSWKAETHGALASSAIFYIASITYALEHLHERNIAYRDLKLENVLLDSRGYVKLCDMGFAKFIFAKSHTLCGTPEYMAPEMIDAPNAHDTNVDWWALGVMTFELMTGQVPWDSSGFEDEYDSFAFLQNIRGFHDRPIPELLIPSHQLAARHFVNRLLQVSVKKRLGSHNDGREVRQDPWFRNFDFEALLNGTLPAPCPGVQSRRERPSVPAALDPTTPSNSQGKEDPLFAPFVDDGSKWDESF